MAKFRDTCPVCKKEYDNYDASYRRWCTVACAAVAAQPAVVEWDRCRPSSPTSKRAAAAIDTPMGRAVRDALAFWCAEVFRIAEGVAENRRAISFSALTTTATSSRSNSTLGSKSLRRLDLVVRKFEFNRIHSHLPCVGLTLERVPVTEWVDDARLHDYGYWNTQIQFVLRVSLWWAEWELRFKGKVASHAY